MKATTFGGYTIELGASWIESIKNDETGEENPIWTLVKKYNLTNTVSNYDDILTYDHNGWVDYLDILARISSSSFWSLNRGALYFNGNERSYCIQRAFCLKKHLQKFIFNHFTSKYHL